MFFVAAKEPYTQIHHEWTCPSHTHRPCRETGSTRWCWWHCCSVVQERFPNGKSPSALFCLSQMHDLHPTRPVMQCTWFPVAHLTGGTGDQAEHGPQSGWIVLAAKAAPRQHICPRTPRSLPLRTTRTLNRLLHGWVRRLERTHPVQKPSRSGPTVRRGCVGFPIQEKDEIRQPARKQTLSALLCSV